MSNLDLHIERLVLRLRGVSPEVARAAANDLGPALLESLAQHRRLTGSTGTAEIGTLSLGTVTVQGTDSPASLRATVARAITDAMAAQRPESHGG
jgi:hypothetical protein